MSNFQIVPQEIIQKLAEIGFKQTSFYEFSRVAESGEKLTMKVTTFPEFHINGSLPLIVENVFDIYIDIPMIAEVSIIEKLLAL